MSNLNNIVGAVTVLVTKDKIHDVVSFLLSENETYPNGTSFAVTAEDNNFKTIYLSDNSFKRLQENPTLLESITE